jgi:hypothetical protein
MLTKEECDQILDMLRKTVGEEGAPIHPKHGWGGFLDVIEKHKKDRQTIQRDSRTSREDDKTNRTQKSL